MYCKTQIKVNNIFVYNDVFYIIGKNNSSSHIGIFGYITDGEMIVGGKDDGRMHGLERLGVFYEHRIPEKNQEISVVLTEKSNIFGYQIAHFFPYVPRQQFDMIDYNSSEFSPCSDIQPVWQYGMIYIFMLICIGIIGGFIFFKKFFKKVNLKKLQK